MYKGKYFVDNVYNFVDNAAIIGLWPTQASELFVQIINIFNPFHCQKRINGIFYFNIFADYF